MPSLGELISEKRRRELELSGLLERQTGEVPGLAQSLATGRERFLSERLAGLPARFQGAAQEVSGLEKSRLAREIEPELQRTRTQRLRGRTELVFQNALRQAQEAGADLRSAQEFALQTAQDEQSRRQRMEEFESKVKTAEEKERIRKEFAQKGLDVEAQFQEPDMFESALSRALGTVLGTAGSFALLGAFQKPKVNPLSPFVSNQLQQRAFAFPTLRQRTFGFVPGGY